jgi:2-polyprenyl-6-methoxyphenol hydroxylase-like FAD-dependent oxidoreductase
MPAVSKVLVVGAGIAGPAVAILLAEGGVTVDLVERKPEVTALGSGITLMGNALRVLRQVGVWDKVEASGFGFGMSGIRAPGPEATLIAEIPDMHTGGTDLPATLGISRPELATILVDRAVAAGVHVEFDVELASYQEHEGGLTATFGDSHTEEYDLIIGADGLNSGIRELMGIDVKPKPTGVGIWRVFTSRPKQIDHTDLYYGGQSYIAGYCPTSEDSLYAYIVEDADPANFELSGPERVARMVELSRAYGGPWNDIRPLITEDRGVNYTFFESHVIDGPWNRGRVVLIGDAAHSCPPTLAQGAAQALEDAAVLAELLLAGGAVDEQLWSAFTARRLARAKAVVVASVQLVNWLLEHNRDADVPGLMREINTMVSVPA